MTQTPTAAEEALATAVDDASLARSIARSTEIEADIAVNPGRYRMFTGVRPTGNMHLGHYFGTMHSWRTIQDAGVDTWILVADYQVITDRDAVGPIRERVLSLVTDALAVGVDPRRSTIFAHSAVPAQNQLMLPFLSLVTESELHRNPTVKSELEATEGRAMSGLLLTYPVHQATDILFCQANLVPVGKDQLPHLEQARLIAQRFDKRYGRAVEDHPVFRRPEALLSRAPMLLGLDGEKMSKSRRNTIELRMSADETAKALRKAKTDSDRVITYDPAARPEVANLLTLASLCGAGEPQEIAERIGDGGAGMLKRITTEAVNEFFAPIRARRADLAADEGYLLHVLHAGNERANAVANETLAAVRAAMGMDYRACIEPLRAPASPYRVRRDPPMTDIVLHDLEPEELDSPELRSLLRLATDYDDARLSRLLVEELPRLTVLTAIPAAVGEGPPVALAAYAPPAPGPSPSRPSATIEYLATAETHRLRGLASALIAEIRRRHPGAAVRARTDDDAIGFYRGMGFLVRPAPADPRWPGRRRYDCLLAPRSPR